MITVFTPTYNRAYIIGSLYKSLCTQTCKNFEWLVVDDGSTDETESLIAGFLAEDKMSIRYIKQDNGGKHIAINTGVKAAKGDLFFIVDSDDHLTPDAVQWMQDKWNEIKDNPRFAGVSGIRIHPDGTKIGGGNDDTDIIDASPLDFQYKYHGVGDHSEAWRTSVLAQYPFPVIENERFCTEGLIWARISQKYIVRYCEKGIYICDYLGDGLTKNRLACRLNNPQYSALAYSEMMNYPQVPFIKKVACAINFWRFSRKGNQSFFSKCRQIGFLGILCFLPAQLFILKDRISE